MPLYEYTCLHCQGRFELLRPMSRADEDVSCPACHHGARRLPSLAASFSKGTDGSTTSLGGASACSSCSASSCATCG